MADWVELRVHGVSGTPPEDTLSRPAVTQVAGDELSRSFRRQTADGTAEPDGLPHLVEAFHWGRHTVSAGRQGLWFLLLPLGMVNVAQYMLPRPRSCFAVVWHAVVGAWLRFLGLVLTLLFAASAAVVLLDLVAWQWIISKPAVRTPTDGRTQTTLPQRLSQFADPWVALVAVLLTVAVVVIIARLGRRVGAEAKAPSSPPGAGIRSELARATFYLGDPNAPALWSLHVGGSLGLIALFVSGIADRGEGHWDAYNITALAVLGLVALVVLLLGDPEQSARVSAKEISRHRKQVSDVIGWSLLGVGIAVLAAAVLRLFLGPTVLDSAHAHAGELRISEWIAQALLAGGALALLGIVLGVAALSWLTRYSRQKSAPPPDPYRRFLWGQAPTVVAALGTFLGAGLSALVTYGAQAALNRVVAGGPPEDSVDVPLVLQRIAYAWGLTVPLVLVVALGVFGWSRTLGRCLRDDVSRQYGVIPASSPGDGPDTVPDTLWQRRIAAAMAQARLKNLLPGLLGFFAVIGLLLYAAMIAEEVQRVVDRSGQVCTRAVVPGFGWLSGYAHDSCRGTAWITWVGSGFLLLLAGRLVSFGISLVRSPEKRRRSNVAWDVIAFWPRSAHPFTPWPYSQRVVADLVARIRHHLQQPQGPDVVLEGHSQGSLISVAALLWLDPAELGRMGYVIYGSQLRMQFTRAFPAFVDFRVMRDVWRALDGRWRSLYRDTDPIAGPALSWDHVWEDGAAPRSVRLDEPATRADDQVSDVTGVRRCGPEWRLLDPAPPLGRDLQNGPFAALRMHGGYYEDPNFAAAVAEVLPHAPGPPPSEAVVPSPRTAGVSAAVLTAALSGLALGAALNRVRNRAGRRRDEGGSGTLPA